MLAWFLTSSVGETGASLGVYYTLYSIIPPGCLVCVAHKSKMFFSLGWAKIKMYMAIMRHLYCIDHFKRIFYVIFHRATDHTYYLLILCWEIMFLYTGSLINYYKKKQGKK